MSGTTTVFSYTGAVQTWTVPAGVTSVAVAARGAGGGAGGLGDQIGGALAVTPGQVLNIYVGGGGGAPAGGTGGAGGWNGGGAGGNAPGSGAGGYGGGGATDIRIGGTALANRVCVAGAGGGSGRGTGGGGGNANAAGGNGTIANGGGKAGTGAAGGAGGTGGGIAGSSGLAGAGSASSANVGGGGGGGAGYYGGGGGGNGNNIAGNATGGGGGGSNYLGAMTATSVSSAVGSGNGSLSLTYDQPPNAPTLNSPASGAYLDPSQPITLAWTFNDPDTTDTQYAAGVHIRIVGAATWSDVTLISNPSSAQSATLSAGTLVAGNQYEWQVQTSDGSVTGPWSASSIFNTVNPPAAPTVTAPVSQITSNPVTISWTTPGAQVAYQARLVADDGAGNPNTATIYSDSGQVNSASQSVALGLGSAGQGMTVHAQVRHQQYSGIWGAWGDGGGVFINVGQPGIPTLAFSTNPANGSITVAITNPANPPATSVSLYRTDIDAIPLSVDFGPVAAVPAAADTLQPLVLSGAPLKIQSGSLAMSFTGSGSQRSDVQFSYGRRLNRARAEFLIESATWTTDGGLLGLLCLATPYLGGAVTPDANIYLTVGRTSWALGYVSAGTLTSLISGTYASLPLDTLLSVEVAANPYTNAITVYLPDGSIRTVTSVATSSISGKVLDALLLVNAANTDRRFRLLNLWGTDALDFGETRIAAGLAPNSSVTDYMPASGRRYRYRATAIAYFGGTSSSA